MAQMTRVERDGIEDGLRRGWTIPEIAAYVKRPPQTVSFDSGHLCHVCLLFDVGIPARRRARPSCQAGEYSEFAELNEGHPLGDDSRDILCSPPIICKENQCPLKN